MQEDLSVIISKNLPNFTISTTELVQKSQFIEKLSSYFEVLLNNDFSSLLQIMYRIDVPEKEFALTLSPSNSDKPSKAIAELVYNRLVLKAQIRLKYKNKDA